MSRNLRLSPERAQYLRSLAAEQEETRTELPNPQNMTRREFIHAMQRACPERISTANYQIGVKGKDPYETWKSLRRAEQKRQQTTPRKTQSTHRPPQRPGRYIELGNETKKRPCREVHREVFSAA